MPRRRQRKGPRTVAPQASPLEARCAARWAWVGLVATVGFAMGRAVFNGFTSWDDPHTLWMNPAFNPPTFDKVMAFWNPKSPEAGLWVPVTYTVWGALAHLGWLAEPGAWGERLSPMVFHAASLIAHIASTLLVFAILRRLLWSTGTRGLRASAYAWAGAAVFGVHPLQVEAVGWASGLKDVLWVLCALAAVYGYLRSAETRRFWLSAWWWAGLLAFATGVLCKPTAMVTPLLAAVAHWLGMRRPLAEAVRGIWPWFVPLPLIAWWTRQIQPGVGIPTLPVPMRPLIALDALAFYLWKLVLPMGLSIDYGRTPAAALAKGYLWWTWIAPVAIALTLVRKRTACPLALAGAAWAVIATAPVSGVVPFLFQYHSTVADHYLYGSMAGVAMVAATLVARLADKTTPKAAAAVVIVVLAGWSGLSIQQMGVWQNDRRLYTQTLTVNPRSVVSWTNLGGGQMLLETRRRQRDPRNIERGIAYADSALAVNPGWSRAHDIKTIGLLLLGRTDEAIASAEKVLDTAPAIPPEIRGSLTVGRELLGALLLRQGRREEAIRQFERAITELDALPSEDREPQRKRLEDLIAKSRQTSGEPRR